MISLPTTLSFLRTSRLDARASLADVAPADLEAASCAGWAAAAAAAALASTAFFSLLSDLPPRPCALTETPVAVP